MKQGGSLCSPDEGIQSRRERCSRSERQLSSKLGRLVCVWELGATRSKGQAD